MSSSVTPGFPASKCAWNFFKNLRFGHGRLFAAFGVFGPFFQAFLDGFQVGQHQFSGNRLDIALRVNRPRHMMDVRVFKTTDDLDQGIDFPDMAEKLVAQALLLAKHP